MKILAKNLGNVTSVLSCGMKMKIRAADVHVETAVVSIRKRKGLTISYEKLTYISHPSIKDSPCLTKNHLLSK